MIRHNQSGFTLIETTLALAIMVVTFAAVLMTQTSSLSALERSRRLTVVTMLLKNKMIETEQELEALSFEEVKEEDSGAFDAPYDEYEWIREIKEIEFPQVDFFGGGGGEESADAETSTNSIQERFSKLVTQYLNDSIREVTVSVSWPVRNGRQTYSVSTFWVDLSRDFRLSQ